MLIYRLISAELSKKIYEYYPEGALDPGQIAFMDNGDIEILKDSSCDVKGYYRMHACQGIDTSKDEGTVAWY